MPSGRCLKLLLQHRDFDSAADQRHPRRHGDWRFHERDLRRDRRRGQWIDGDSPDGHAQRFELARGLATEFVRKQLAAALVLLQGLARSTEILEQAHHRDVRRLGQGIQRQQGSRVAEGQIGRRTQALDERRHDGDMLGVQLFALGDAPCVEPVADGQVQTVEKSPHKAQGKLGQRFGCDLVQSLARRRPNPFDIDIHVADVQGDALPVGAQTPQLTLVDERPQLAQAPAQLRAGIIRAIPKQRAQVLAQLGLSRRRQVGEQRARLLRRRQSQGASVSNQRKLAQQPHLQSALFARCSLHSPIAPLELVTFKRLCKRRCKRGGVILFLRPDEPGRDKENQKNM